MFSVATENVIASSTTFRLLNTQNYLLGEPTVIWFHATLPIHPPKSTELFAYTSSHSTLSNHKHKRQETATF